METYVLLLAARLSVNADQLLLQLRLKRFVSELVYIRDSTDRGQCCS